MATHWEIEIRTGEHWNAYMNRAKTRAVRFRTRTDAGSFAMALEINHDKQTRLVRVQR